MKIGIDASAIAKENITGVENYVRNLVLELSKLERTGIEFHLYSPRPFHNFPILPKNFKIIIQPGRLWHQIVLPRMINKDNVDVFFSPSYMLPLGLKTKSVFHCHDLAWKYFPKAYSRKEFLIQLVTLRRAKKYASRIITSSSSTKTDMMKYFNIPEKNIAIVPLGVDPSISKFKSSDKKRTGIIYIGRFELRKNLLNILDAYNNYRLNGSVLRVKLRNGSASPEPLVLCGTPGYRFPEISKKIQLLARQGADIKIFRSLPPSDLYKLLGTSKMLVFASLYEGFGLPILEAFSLGTAVITSKTSSMPEVAGKGALLVDPKNISQIAASMEQLATADGLRLKLINEGYSIVKKFSWSSTAISILKELEDVAKQN